jgi:hypothetical protein
MTIAHWDLVKKLNLYPLAKALTESEFTQCFQYTNDDEEVVQPILTIDQVMYRKNDIEENQIINFINNPNFTQYHGGQHTFDHKHILDKYFQENYTMDTLPKISGSISSMKSISESSNVAIEIYQGKTLNINSKLEEFQKEQLIKKLQKHLVHSHGNTLICVESTLIHVFIIFI